MTTTLPQPKGIPAGVKDPLAYRWALTQVMQCFATVCDLPDWLVDAFYDASFDPAVQAVLERTKGVEPS